MLQGPDVRGGGVGNAAGLWGKGDYAQETMLTSFSSLSIKETPLSNKPSEKLPLPQKVIFKFGLICYFSKMVNTHTHTHTHTGLLLWKLQKTAKLNTSLIPQELKRCVFFGIHSRLGP